MEISVEVIRSDRRSVSLEIRPDGVVLVRAPLRMGTPRLRAFVEANRGWIEDKLQKLAAQPRAERLSGEELAALKKDARRVFSDRAAHFAPLLGVKFGRITVRCQKSKWGSCSAKGNPNFNCLLLLAPGEVLDYVVVHELCHRREMNHSARFWKLVADVLPDYEARRRWLRKNGAALMARLY